MGDNIKGGMQGSASGKAIEYGVRKGLGEEFDRRPNKGDQSATYKFDKQSGSGPSGHAATQTKGLGKHSSIGGSSAFTPKGKVGSFGGATGKFGTMKTGLSGQKKGVGA